MSLVSSKRLTALTRRTALDARNLAKTQSPGDPVRLRAAACFGGDRCLACVCAQRVYEQFLALGGIVFDRHESRHDRHHVEPTAPPTYCFSRWNGVVLCAHRGTTRRTGRNCGIVFRWPRA